MQGPISKTHSQPSGLRVLGSELKLPEAVRRKSGRKNRREGKEEKHILFYFIAFISLLPVKECRLGQSCGAILPTAASRLLPCAGGQQDQDQAKALMGSASGKQHPCQPHVAFPLPSSLMERKAADMQGLPPRGDPRKSPAGQASGPSGPASCSHCGQRASLGSSQAGPEGGSLHSSHWQQRQRSWPQMALSSEV